VPYSLLNQGAALRILSPIASLTPLRYPMPYPTNQAATAQPAMKSQVRPLGVVHTMCTVAPLGPAPGDPLR
jgi:hypothetical protein